MNTYKITNITNLAGKRDLHYNSTLNIDYVDGRIKKIMSIGAGNIAYLTVPSLPLSIHRLRLKKLITVLEVNPNELIKPKAPPVAEIKPAVIKNTTTKRKTKKVDGTEAKKDTKKILN